MREGSGIRRYFRLPRSEGTVAGDIDEEIAFHIEARTAELIAAGNTRDAARRKAELEFGDVSLARSELAEIDRVTVQRERRVEWWDALLLDMQVALRGMVRNPGFTVTVVLTLALGIGVNAAMFGITDRVLLSPPPHIADADDIVRVLYQHTPSSGVLATNAMLPYPDYELFRTVDAFEQTGAFAVRTGVLGRGATATEIRLAQATSSLFPVLGTEPALGRFFTAEEDALPRGQPVVVLGHALWQDRFGGDASVVGTTVEIDHRSYEVIGVAPRGFNGVNLDPVHAWVPASIIGPDMGGEEWYAFRGMHYLQVIARLRADVDPDVAVEQATAVFRAGNAERFADDATAQVVLGSVIAARSPVTGSAGTPQRSGRISLWLLGVSLLVVMIACVNVINLLLARGMRQRRETGVRLAMGMGRARLAALTLTETVMITLLGAGLALLLAHWGGQLARTALLPDVEWTGSTVSPRVIAFTAGIALACALLAGIAPALHAARGDVTALLGPGGRATYRASRVRSGLVALQAGLSVLLLVGAGLFLRSMDEAGRIALGYDTDRVAGVTWHLSGLDWDRERRLALYDESLERARVVPQVEAAALSMTQPLGSRIYGYIRVPGVDSIPTTRDIVYSSVSVDYFRTVGARLVQGRPFAGHDVQGSPPVAIVTESLARVLWPGEPALGRCFMTSTDADAPCREVVGVVEDTRYGAVLEEPSLMYYLPLAQETLHRSMRALLVRIRGDHPDAGLRAVRDALHAIDPGLPHVKTELLEARVAPALVPWRLGAVMFTAFGILALVLAVLGLYGVVSYDVAQRRREMGVRAALGARAGNVLRLVIGDAARVVVAGLVIGLAAAAIASRWIEPLLFNTSARDPLVHTGVAALLLAVALAAAAVPAWRAARIQPTEALRDD